MTANPERPLTPDPPAPPGDDVRAPDIHFSRPDEQPDTPGGGADAAGRPEADGSSGGVAGDDVNIDAVSPEPPD